MTVSSTRSSLTLSVVDYEDLAEDKYLLAGNVQSGNSAPEATGGQTSGKTSRSQLGLIYSLHLAEAIVAASIQPQLYMLLRDEKLCGSVNSVYWSGVVETVFAIGSIAGLFWGWLGDRLGRRPVALVGMVGMAASCMAMGFTTGVVSCALIRGFAGLMSSSMRVMVWTMLGDVSDTPKAKARNFSRMPIVATGGIIGPLLQALLANRLSGSEIWQRFPILSSQLACAGLMVIFFTLNFFFLQETLPEVDRSSSAAVKYDQRPYVHRHSSESYTEKDTFLGQDIPFSPEHIHHQGHHDHGYTYTSEEKPKPLTFSAAIRAPSLLVLLTSFSFLSLHSSSFDQLLPLLGSSPVENGGLGLPCSFLSIVVLVTSSLAAAIVYIGFSKAIERVGLLRLYRVCCWLFPLIYVLTPLFSTLSRGSVLFISISSGTSIFIKTVVTCAAQTLVVFLVTNASPDSYSLGSIMGLLHSASAPRALAVAGTGMAFMLADGGVGLQVVNLIMWICLTATAVSGAILAWFVRERATVNRDWMANVLKWEVCYVNESLESLGLEDGDEEKAFVLGGFGHCCESSYGSETETETDSEFGCEGDGSDGESVIV